MIRRITSILLLLVLCSGCSIYKIDSQDTTLDFYSPKSSEDQVTYIEKVDKPYEVIAIESITADRTRPFQEIVDKMRQEASVLGGDAITDIRPISSKVGVTLLKNADLFAHYSAKVIVFK